MMMCHLTTETNGGGEGGGDWWWIANVTKLQSVKSSFWNFGV